MSNGSPGGPRDPDFCGPSMWDAWNNRWSDAIVNVNGRLYPALVEDCSPVPWLEALPTPFLDLMMREREAQTD